MGKGGIWNHPPLSALRARSMKKIGMIWILSYGLCYELFIPSPPALLFRPLSPLILSLSHWNTLLFNPLSHHPPFLLVDPSRQVSNQFRKGEGISTMKAASIKMHLNDSPCPNPPTFFKPFCCRGFLGVDRNADV